LAWISHPQDKKNLNDTLRETVYVEVGKDALVTAISAPKDSQIFYYNDQLDSIQVTVLNQGRENMSQVAVNCQVFFEKSIVLNDQKQVDLNSGESKVVVFYPNKIWNIKGKGKVICETNHLDDQNIANDSMVRSFEVRSMRDLAINTVDSPNIGGSFIAGIPIKPQVSIENTGDDSAIVTQKIKLEIFSNDVNGSVIFSEEMLHPALNPSDAMTLFALNSFIPPSSGTYWIRAYAINNKDENAANDTLSGSFKVLTNTTHQLIENSISVYPNPSQSGDFTLKSTQELQAVGIFTPSGQKVAEFEQVSSNSIDLKIKGSGLYFIKGITTSGSQFFTNIVVE
jgi:hypothetical protein